MKTIFTIVASAAFSLSAQQVFSTSFTNPSFSSITGNRDKDKEISIGSSRGSADMVLHFIAGKEGVASITILDETGKIVLKQTNQVTQHINTILLKNAAILAEGSYTVKLISNNETYTTRVLVWK